MERRGGDTSILDLCTFQHIEHSIGILLFHEPYEVLSRSASRRNEDGIAAEPRRGSADLLT
jgi:hypothetical protein